MMEKYEYDELSRGCASYVARDDDRKRNSDTQQAQFTYTMEDGLKEQTEQKPT